MNNNYEESSKDFISFRKNKSTYSNIDKFNIENSLLLNNKRKKYRNEISTGNSLIKTNNRFSSLLNNSTKSIKLIKYINNNNSSLLIDNSKLKKKFLNYYALSQPNQRSNPDSMANSLKRKKKMSMTYLKKNEININNYSNISLKSDSTFKLQNNLKLFSDFNYKNKKLKESINILKNHSFIENNKSHIKNINFIKIPEYNSSLLENQFNIKKKGVNKEKENESEKNRKKEKEGSAFTSRANSDRLSYEIDLNRIYKNKYSERKLMKDFNEIKNNEENKKQEKYANAIKDITGKLYSNMASIKIKNDNYSKKYYKNKFQNKNPKKMVLKSFISKSKELNNQNNQSIKKGEPEKAKRDYYLSDINLNKSDKKITVALNDKKIRIKNNKNIHINMNLINLPSNSNQNIFSPFSIMLIQSHVKSLSILSTKHLNKKEKYISTDNSQESMIESSKIFKNNNNEHSELNNIVSRMNKEMKRFRNNTSFYLNGERNFFTSPDGPEDFHFRFVELCKQNNAFFRRLKLNIGNKQKKDKDKKEVLKELYELENKKYFENIEEEVPYI